jgi:hypothetical protein
LRLQREQEKEKERQKKKRKKKKKKKKGYIHPLLMGQVVVSWFLVMSNQKVFCIKQFVKFLHANADISFLGAQKRRHTSRYSAHLRKPVASQHSIVDE